LQGAAVLSLPQSFDQAGWLLGSVLLVLSALGSIMGMHLLFVAASKFRGTAPTFASVAASISPGLAWFVEFIVALCSTAACVAYLIVIGSLMPLVSPFLFGVGSDSMLAHKPFWVTLLAFGFCFPLSCLHRFNNLKFSSSTFPHTSLVFFVFFQAPRINVGDADAKRNCSIHP
jgi:amino acid permease